MELTLQVNNDVARKLRGLSVLTGKTADEITEDLSNSIDSILTNEIINSVGGDETANAFNPTGGAIAGGSALHPALGGVDLAEDGANKSVMQVFGPEGDFEHEEVETAGEGLSDLTEEELDQELPQKFSDEDNEDEEEEDMAIKDRDGNKTTYEDELMADVQSMADDDFEDADSGLVSEDPALSAASFNGKASVTQSSGEIRDVSDNTADILPTDFDIDSVAGNNKGAVDFFDKAFFGAEGDKAKRNGVKRKAIRRMV